MHLIVFTHRLATPRSVTITARHMAITAMLGLCAVVAGAAMLYYLTFRYAADLKLPVLDQLVASARADDAKKSDEYLRQNLNAMAVKLGEMQAQLMRLDALGERVSGMAGIKPTEFRLNETPGRGGAVPSAMRDLSMAEFSKELDQVAHGVDTRNDFFNIMESELFNAKLASKRLPTVLPVNATYNASGFGTRIDPITGQHAMHEGIDFIAQPGTPIVAAAYGVVIAAEFHHDFGNMIEIDHGNDIVTRYAHTSVMHVKAGDIVKRGQLIGAVGTTGRSTGPHLHFEVRYQGVAQNPARFLQTAERLPAPPNIVAQNTGAGAMQVGNKVLDGPNLPSTPSIQPAVQPAAAVKPGVKLSTPQANPGLQANPNPQANPQPHAQVVASPAPMQAAAHQEGHAGAGEPLPQ